MTHRPNEASEVTTLLIVEMKVLSYFSNLPGKGIAHHGFQTPGTAIA